MAETVWVANQIAYNHAQICFIGSIPGLRLWASVTRFGDLLHIGQFFKACGNKFFAKIYDMFREIFKGVKMFHFSSEIIFGQL